MVNHRFGLSLFNLFGLKTCTLQHSIMTLFFISLCLPLTLFLFFFVFLSLSVSLSISHVPLSHHHLLKKIACRYILKFTKSVNMCGVERERERESERGREGGRERERERGRESERARERETETHWHPQLPGAH